MGTIIFVFVQRIIQEHNVKKEVSASFSLYNYMSLNMRKQDFEYLF